MNLHKYLKDVRKEGKRSFTIKDVIDQFNVSAGYARLALSRLIKAGDLISPAKGFYVIVPPEDQFRGSIPPEQLVPLVMQYWDANYYVALLSAGLYYGATHQKVAKFQVISDRRVKHPLVFGDVEIDFVYKKSIAGLPTQQFTVNTGYLIVSSSELTALDLLAYPNHAGGLNHIATVLSELSESINVVKLIKLAQRINSEFQLQRIGYILDNIETVNEKKTQQIIDALEMFINACKPSYLPLASEIPKSGYARSKKWRIIENSPIESDL